MVFRRDICGLAAVSMMIMFMFVFTALHKDEAPRILSSVLEKDRSSKGHALVRRGQLPIDDSDDSSELESLSSSSSSKNAYCVFLSEPNDMIKPDQEDFYFMGTRMLMYQLLHDPETKTKKGIPFVVLVTAKVPQWKRDQLEYEGAQVIEVSSIKIDWIKPGRIRWANVMDKLHVFELTQFDKVLLLDTDMVVTRRMDGVFDDPAAKVKKNLQKAENIKDDEGAQPSEYLMAANGVNAVNHTYPTERWGRLNAGFVLFKPSMEMYKYYMSVAQIEGRFPGGSPEQDLWNYAHRREGNMPWSQLDPDWTINSPNIGDYKGGIASLHEKYWRCRDKEVKAVLQRSRWKMEGFFQSYVPPS